MDGGGGERKRSAGGFGDQAAQELTWERMGLDGDDERGADGGVGELHQSKPNRRKVVALGARKLEGAGRRGNAR